MMHFIKLYCGSLMIFLLADFIWIAAVASQAYSSFLNSLLRRSGDALQPIWWAALLVYALLVLGIVVFVTPRSATNWQLGLLWGGLFGAITYGTYTLTNYALLSDWPLPVVAIDIAGGVLVCLITGGAAVCLDRYFS